MLAMQCHVEMTRELVSYWIERWDDDLQISSASEQTGAQIMQGLEEKVAEINQVAEQLYGRWLETLSNGGPRR